MAIKNCVVHATDNIRSVTLVDGKVYTDPVKAVAAVVTATGWTDKLTKAYLEQLPRLSYFDAVEVVVEDGKTLAKAVELLAGKSE